MRVGRGRGASSPRIEPEGCHCSPPLTTRPCCAQSPALESATRNLGPSQSTRLFLLHPFHHKDRSSIFPSASTTAISQIFSQPPFSPPALVISAKERVKSRAGVTTLFAVARFPPRTTQRIGTRHNTSSHDITTLALASNISFLIDALALADCRLLTVLAASASRR